MHRSIASHCFCWTKLGTQPEKPSKGRVAGLWNSEYQSHLQHEGEVTAGFAWTVGGGLHGPATLGHNTARTLGVEKSPVAPLNLTYINRPAGGLTCA